MRNRGIEVFMSEDLSSADAERAMSVVPRDSLLLQTPETTEKQDLAAVLALEGVPGTILPRAMVAAHLHVVRDAAAHHRCGRAVSLTGPVSCHHV
jgi:hypothetical protein